jgi:ribosome-associated heat shock protein Hsp15
LDIRPVNTADPAGGARLDKWLWALRLFKSRALAADACRAGSVLVNGRVAKPARDLHAAEVITLRQGLVTRTLVVLGFPKGRVAAKQVPEHMEDQTPAAEYERAREHKLQHFLEREKGSGRPTKRERRQLDKLVGL